MLCHKRLPQMWCSTWHKQLLWFPESRHLVNICAYCAHCAERIQAFVLLCGERMRIECRQLNKAAWQCRVKNLGHKGRVGPPLKSSIKNRMHAEANVSSKAILKSSLTPNFHWIRVHCVTAPIRFRSIFHHLAILTGCGLSSLRHSTVDSWCHEAEEFPQ